METIVNGKKYRIYELDSIITFTERLASNINTLPKYIYYKNIDNLDSINVYEFANKNLEVVNILDIIKKNIASGTFSKLYNEIKTILEKTNLSLEKDILVPFIILNDDLQTEDSSIVKTYLLSIENEINKELKLFKTQIRIIDDIWAEVDILIEQFNEELIKLKNKVKTQDKLYKNFDEIEEVPYYTDFELERAILELELNINKLNILEIFNNIKLNNYVPFATIKKFYKIYKEFVPPLDWNITLENVIILKTLQKQTLIGSEIEDYGTILIGSEKELGGNNKEEKEEKEEKEKEITNNIDKILASVPINILTNNLTKEQYITRFLETLGSDVNIIKETEQRVNGVYYIPNQKLNKYIFSDMIMNNPIFSQFMSIDESAKASKKKNNIYVYFKHPNTGEVTVNITEKSVNVSETAIRKTRTKLGKLGIDLFPDNSYFIRIKVSRASNTDSVILFQQLLAKIFVLYNQEEDSIAAYYKKFIPEFGIIKEEDSDQEEDIEKPQTKKRKYAKKQEKVGKEGKEGKEEKLLNELKNKAPELFVQGYAKECLKKPNIVSNEDLEEILEQGLQVMTFPKADSGYEQFNYVCNHPEHKYPGLRVNKTESKDIFPFVPCCYTTDHSKKKGSIYRHYYYGEELPEKKEEGQTRELIVTNKILNYEGTGILPNNLLNFLNLAENNPDYTFVRKGVYRNKNSFLQCILYALNYEYNGKKIQSLKNKKDIEKFVDEIRLVFASEEYAAACKQELYDRSISEIIETIKNGEEYFDPRIFVGLIEKYFDCNVFIYSRKELEAQLILPRFLEGYYKFANKNNTIIILEHYGGESDHAEYPQCEIIAKVLTKKLSLKPQYSYEWSSPIASTVRNIFSKLSRTYVFGKDKYNVIKDFPLVTDGIYYQYIDSYGKMRYIEFEIDGEVISMFTEPMAPFIVTSVDKIDVKKVDYIFILSIADKINLEIIGQNVENTDDKKGKNITKELIGKIGNIIVSIPINEVEQIDGIDIVENTLSYVSSQQSFMDDYNNCKKIARYLTEYVYWLYSKFYNEKVQLLDKTKQKYDYISSLELIYEFYEKYITIDSKFVYGKIGKKFSMKSSLMNNNKLVINNLETAKRLLYVLRQYSIRHRQKLINYRNLETIESYYLDITDFEQYYYQIILEGDDSIQKWINEQKNKYSAYSNILINENQPYFFIFDEKIREQYREHNIYLAQNTNTLKNALEIAEKWHTDKYNIGKLENEVDIDEELDLTTNAVNRPEFILYSYISSSEVKRYKVKGNKVDYQIKIVGYKVEKEDKEDNTDSEMELVNQYTVLLQF